MKGMEVISLADGLVGVLGSGRENRFTRADPYTG